MAVAASDFAIKCPSVIVMADDPAYQVATSCPDLIFIRKENEETRMPGNVRWVDAVYLCCYAYKVSI